MNEEQRDNMLQMLKTDLGIRTNAYDERLGKYLESGEKFIKEEGAALDFTDIQDMQLCVMYAAWMWRKRDNMERMPRMLRLQLNNRVMSRKMRDDG